MFINKTYKFKLKLNSTQTSQINQMIGSCRWLFNLAKETKEYAYKSNHISLSVYDIQKQLTELKKEAIFLKDTPSQSLQDVIERLDKAYQSFFKGGGYPKWAKRDKYNSITFKSVKIDTYNRIKLPKLNSIKYFNSQEIKGELKRATIIKENNNYYISILTKQAISDLPYSCESQAEIGIDMGIAFFLVSSNGEYINNPKFLNNTLKVLRVENRSLARKVKRSNNWSKQKKVVGKLHLKIKNQRNDFINKVSTKLVLENRFIAREKLNIKGMVKSRLSRSISDVAWGIFFNKLDYKTDWYGGVIEEVNPAYTSQKCNVCGHIAKENRLTQSKFKCIKCGHKDNADENSSKNILGRALSNFREREALACA